MAGKSYQMVHIRYQRVRALGMQYVENMSPHFEYMSQHVQHMPQQVQQMPQQVENMSQTLTEHAQNILILFAILRSLGRSRKRKRQGAHGGGVMREGHAKAGAESRALLVAGMVGRVLKDEGGGVGDSVGRKRRVVGSDVRVRASHSKCALAEVEARHGVAPCCVLRKESSSTGLFYGKSCMFVCRNSPVYDYGKCPVYGRGARKTMVCVDTTRKGRGGGGGVGGQRTGVCAGSRRIVCVALVLACAALPTCGALVRLSLEIGFQVHSSTDLKRTHLKRTHRTRTHCKRTCDTSIL